ncbi:MAG: tetratricopeptide repeat protein [Planctomycetota bacterium]
MRNKWLALPLALALELSVVGTAAAQENELSDDIEFARTLSRYRYFDLASDLLEGLARRRTSPEDQHLLAFAKASILRVAAEYESDQARRVKYFEQAIEGYHVFLANLEPDNPRFQDARLELAEVLTGYGRFLRDQIQPGAADAESLRNRASEMFKEAVSLANSIHKDCKELAAALAGQNSQQAAEASRKAFLALYQRGVAYYEWALAYPLDAFNRADYLTKAVEAFEDFLFENEEPGLLTSYAYFFQGIANSEMARLPDSKDPESKVSIALAALHYVLEDEMWGLWAVLEANPTLDAGWLEEIRDLAERVTHGIADIELRRSQPDAAIKAVQGLDAKREKHGLGKPGPFGELATLLLARAFHATGKSGDAIRLAQEVANRNTGSRVGIEAQKTLAQWIGTDSGQISQDVPPDVLFTAAEGQFNQANYLEAIAQYHMVLTQLVRQGDQKLTTELAPKCWHRIGRSCDRQRRYLEAAIAYEEGLRRYPEASQELREANASDYYNALLRRSVETKDGFDIQRKDGVRQELVKIGIGDLQFLIAQDKFNDALTKEDASECAEAVQAALREFDIVEKSSIYYERAWIYRARCFFELGNLDEALKLLNDYEEYTKDPRTTPGPEERRYREVALTDLVYYRGLFHKEHASKLLADPQNKAAAFAEYGQVIDIYKGFEQAHPDMADYLVLVQYHRLDSRVGRAEVAPDLATSKQELAEAEVLLGGLKGIKHQFAEYAPYRLAEGHLAVYKMINDPSSEEAKAQLRMAADFLWSYSESKNHNSFQNLRNVGDWYFELKDWEKALTCYQTLISRFGQSNNDAVRRVIAEEVSKNLARTYNELRQFDKAKPLWDVFKPEDSKSLSVVRGAALCYGGWLEETAKGYVEVSGSGDFAKAVQLWSRLFIEYFRGSEGKYSPEWWEIKFMTIYSRYRAGLTDPSYHTQARDLLQNLKAFKPDLGGEPFRSRFRWLEKQLE